MDASQRRDCENSGQGILENKEKCSSALEPSMLIVFAFVPALFGCLVSSFSSLIQLKRHLCKGLSFMSNAKIRGPWT